VLCPSGNAWRSIGPLGESFPAYAEVSLAVFSVVGSGVAKNISEVVSPVQRGFSCSSRGHLYIDITPPVSLHYHSRTAFFLVLWTKRLYGNQHLGVFMPLKLPVAEKSLRCALE